jgi:hypothetical protein
MTNLEELTPNEGERYLAFGTSRAGKSALLEWNLRHVQSRRPSAMPVIVDTKPRFRAEQAVNRWGRRVNAAKLYDHWAKGPVVPNSVVMDIHSEKPWKGLFKNEGEVVIMQSGETIDWKRMLSLLNAYTQAHIKDRERIMVVDEALDFYSRNTWGIDPKNDVFYRACRAGGERKISTWIGAHRVHGLPPLILNMASRISLFHLSDDRDMMHLRSAGIKDPESPDGDYVFRQWQKQPGGTISNPVTARLKLPDSYLKQLSES